MKRIFGVIALSWWVVYTGGISHALDQRVAGPYFSESDCDRAALALNAKGQSRWGGPLVANEHYFCESSEE